MNLGHFENCCRFTGKSLSETDILASRNPLFDNRLFIELQVQHMNYLFLFFHSKQFVHTTWAELYFFCNSKINLSPYYGLIDASMRASDTDLPVIRDSRWRISTSNICNSVIDLMKINSNVITNTAHSGLDVMEK